jgi:hypothetical protein
MDFRSMDRFRGRLVVLIFDAMGKHAIGLRSQYLNKRAQSKSDSRPEDQQSRVAGISKVFFGHHMAKDAVQKLKVTRVRICRSLCGDRGRLYG